MNGYNLVPVVAAILVSIFATVFGLPLTSNDAYTIKPTNLPRA